MRIYPSKRLANMILQRNRRETGLTRKTDFRNEHELETVQPSIINQR